jgi:hypothetical protein
MCEFAFATCIPVTDIQPSLAYGTPRILPALKLDMSSASNPESDAEYATLSQSGPAGSKSESGSGSGSGSESGSESDSLDNGASRKRRKMSRDSTSRQDIVSLSVNVPSRIKPKTASPQSPTVRTPVTVAETQAVVPLHASASFQDLDLKPWLTQSLKNMAIQRSTRIQQLTIPAILEGRDIIGSSRTGSGKTGQSEYSP